MATDMTEAKEAYTDKSDRVRIFDTTQRDGEQSPGAAMTHEEKIEVAMLLDEMGIDIIEAGFPVSSNGDFEAVSAIAGRVKNSVVCGLARAGFKDIDRAGEALRSAPRRRIHTFISTSPVDMKHKLQMEPPAVLEAVAASVTRARSWTDDVQWSAEDATRTDHDFLCRAVELAIKAGATTINIPATVGYATPQEYFELMTMLVNRVPGVEKIVCSTHCHNALGLAVATSRARALAGGSHPKNAPAYEIMNPVDVGVTGTALVLGKLSGRHAFRAKLASLGYQPGDNALQDAFRRFKDLADKKKHSFDADIIALVDDSVIRGKDPIQVQALKVTAGKDIAPSAELALIVAGEVRSGVAGGDGPVDAIFNAIRQLYPHPASLQLFQVSAVTEGTDAQAKVSVP